MGSLSTPDEGYSGYTEAPEQPDKCCRNCIHFKPRGDRKGICFEYEVMPSAGCKFFKAE